MAVQGGTVSHYYILVIRKFIGFMSLFRHSVWFFFFCLTVSPCRVWNMHHIADKNRRNRAVFCLQTLGKLRSLQGTELL